MRKLLLRIIEKIENAPLSLGAWVGTFFAIVFGRYIIEKYLIGFQELTLTGTLYTLSHYFLEFIFVAVFFIFIIRWAGQGTFAQVANFTLFGFLLIWTPPVVDYFILHNPGVFSLYEFGTLRELGRSFLTFFDDSPDIGITYGIRFEIAVAVAVITLYSYLKLHSLLRALFAGLLTYTMLFVTSTLPSWLAILLLGPSRGWLNVGERESVELFLSPTAVFGSVAPLFHAAHFKMTLVYGSILPFLIGFLLFLFFRPYFVALWKNSRFPQVIYHGGLFLLGALFAFVYSQPVILFDIFHLLALLVVIVAVISAWLASVVVNDFADEEIDRLTNPNRPLPSGSIPRFLYRTLGTLFFAASFFLPLLISPAVALLLLAYQALAWIYSAWPLRLKRFPLIATGLSAIASLLIFFAGFILLSSEKAIGMLPSEIPLFLLIAYTLALPLKDFKDITGDRQAGVHTLPVLLGEVWAKRVLGAAIFILFTSSVFLIHIEQLFPLALFFGSLAYWILHLSSPNHRYFTYRSLPAWLIALATAYGCFLFFSLL